MLLIIILLAPFQICTKIHGDIHNFVFIAGVVDICDKLYRCQRHRRYINSDKLSLVSLIPLIKPCYGIFIDTCVGTLAKNQLACTSKWALSKNPYESLNSHPGASQQNMKISKCFSLFAGVVDTGCAADFSLLNLPKGKSLGHSKPATNS